ncbi:MAG: hypothetical protein SO412_11605, partial [Erysipelotrichaceae bacterium]|nr:hypothetical protein [Erysipelotrichaceae bacterium]
MEVALKSGRMALCGGTIGSHRPEYSFAKEKNLKYTTFLTWLDIYREYQLNKENDGAILTSSTPEVKVPRFIEISERTIEDIGNKPKPDTGKVVLKYKDIAL